MKISYKLSSELQLVPGFISGIIDKIKALPLQENDFFNIRLSIEEALINAIKHGNKNRSDLSVEIAVEAKDDALIVEIKDQGKGFDFEHLDDPTRPQNLEKLSGRGIFLIRTLMDTVEFFDGGRGIRMVKFIKKGD